MTVDGRREAACKSPCDADLSEGVHTLIAKKEGYRSTLQNFHVSGQDEEEVTVTLNPVSGSLQLESQPSGAEITLDGIPRTEVRPRDAGAAGGKIQRRLSRQGYAPYEFDAVVLPESVREISVKLAK